jgi:glutaminase
VNRQVGIASYSPRLDPQGDSCGGIEVCVDLASRLAMHVLDCLNVGSSFVSARG